MGPDGEPTDDPERGLAGVMLPMADYKGFGLAFMIDVLTACLSGALISPVHDCPRGDGVPPFLIPGEREARYAEERASSIPLDDSTARLLEELAAELGAPLPNG